jgi:hypothetical protein
MQNPEGLEAEFKKKNGSVQGAKSQTEQRVRLLTLRNEVWVGSSFELHSTWNKQEVNE